MKRKIFSFGFVFIVVFIFGIFFVPQITLANRKASVIISPEVAFVEENLTYTYTITNTNDGTTTAGIGSIEIQLPTEFETPSVINISSISPDSKKWELASSDVYINGFDSANNKIGIKASGIENKIDKNEFIEIQITTNAPATPNSYQWTTFIWANLGFDGDPIFELTSQPTVIVTAPATENIIIRNGDNVIYNNETIPLPSNNTINIDDNTGVTHPVSTDSVLGLIYSLSQTTESTFSLSNLQYYNSMGFMIKCITPKGQDQLCDNWQYVVNGVAPWDSIDNKILSGGETIGIYFGYPYKITFDKISINTGESFTATAQKYSYSDNKWNPLTDVIIRVTQPNLNDQWNPIVITSQAVDSNSSSTFILLNEGAYNIDISDSFGNFYYTQTYTVTANTTNSGGGGNTTPTEKTFSVSNALNFLFQNKENASIFIYDWIAIAAGAGDNSNLKSSLIDYLKSNPIDSSVVTDNERRAMTLMSLGINPYTGTSVDYIKKITDSFDGTQFGDSSLINDDIFALIVLSNAGYSSSDEIIFEDVKYLLDPSRQPSNGFWESIDMTSAVIQALRGFENIIGVPEAISKAENYLISNQGSDNGFGNSFSTSWVLQSLFNNNQILKAENYLALNQQTDGGMEDTTSDISNRVWSTSYAIPAILHKSWKSIMQTFSKPTIVSRSSNSNKNIQSPEIEPILPIITTPIPNPDLVKKVEDKKIIKVTQIKNIKKSPSSTPINSESLTNNFTENNLGASAGNAVTTEISLKGITKTIIYSVVNILTYIGKGFVGLINFLFAF